MVKTKSAAEVLAEQLRPTLPEGWTCSECLMLNMSNPYGEQPERVLVCPKREVLREHRLAKTRDVLCQKARELWLGYRAQGYAGGVDGSTVYLNPTKL